MPLVEALQRFILPRRQQSTLPPIKIVPKEPPPFRYVDSAEAFLQASTEKTSGVIWQANHHLKLDGFLEGKTEEELASLQILYADVSIVRENGVIKDITFAESDDTPETHRNIEALKLTPIWEPLVEVAMLHAQATGADKFMLRALNPSNTSWHDHLRGTTTCAFRGAGSDLQRKLGDEISTNVGDIVHIPGTVNHRTPPSARFQRTRYAIVCGG